MIALDSLLTPLCGEGERLAYNCGDRAVLLRQNGALRVSPEDVPIILTNRGLAQTGALSLDGNTAWSFRDPEGALVHLYACPAENCVRCLYDPNPCPPMGAPKPLRGGVKLWQLEIDHSLIDCGMCYIFQLGDGSFFVIDSGHLFSVRDDERIFAFLRERAPHGEPVRVRGWFFTHGHSDHVTKFMDILQFNREIRIDALYRNLASPDHPDAVYWDPSERRTEKKFRDLTEASGIPIYKPHAFQRFSIEEIEFTVLCTHEDVFPAPLRDYNDTSTVLLARVGEDRVLFPGDASGEVSPILEKRFSHALRCDVLQQAHHGHFGLSEAFYKKANAPVLLSPTTRIKYDEEYPRYTANQTAAALAEYVFIASDGTTEFTFPLAGSSIVRYPDRFMEDFNGIARLWNYQYDDAFKADLRRRFDARQTTETFAFPKKRTGDAFDGKG